jgi:hypothetical protein
MRLARVIVLVSLPVCTLVGVGSAGSSAAVRVPSRTEALCGKPWTRAIRQFISVFGSAVGTAGDVNGDGYDEAIIGASILPDTRETGVVFVYRGCP